MRRINIFYFFLLLLLGCSSPEKNSEPTQPNILFVSIDDLNDWIAPLGGHSQAITPNLDKLFEQGVAFSNAHCSQAVCTASRNSLLSGIHPTTSGWYASTKAMRTNYSEFMENHAMLPEYLKNNGYSTYAAGKVFHDGRTDYPDKTDDFWTDYAPEFWEDMEEHIEKAGFGYRGKMFYPFTKDGGQLVQLYGEENVLENYMPVNRFYSLCGGPLSEDEIPEGGMYDEQIADWAINQISKKQDKPFFMACGFIRPHVPYTAPQKYFDLYDKDAIVVPDIPENEFSDIPVMGKSIAFGRTPLGGWYDVNRKKEILPELVHSYLACVSFVDDQIGKVLTALENSPNANNTIIVLWSDHGQHLGEKRHFRKQALWEESTHVPLFFKLPGMKHEGETCEKAVSLLDIYPTLMDLCKLPKNKKLEGNSLIPLLENPELEWDKPVLNTWYYKNHAVRSNNWRYIKYRDGGEELYDHRNDPGEHVNLAGDPAYAEVIAELQKSLPKTDAIPAGKTKYTADKLDRRVKEWAKNDSIPVWLR